MSESADGFEFSPPAEFVQQIERNFRPMVTRMLPRTSALTVGLVLLVREWLQRTWDVSVALRPTLLLCAAVVLPLLLVIPLFAIASARRLRYRIDAGGLHESSLPGMTLSVRWDRVRALSLVERGGVLALEASVRLPLGTPETRRFAFDPQRSSRTALLGALLRFAPAPLTAALPQAGSGSR